MSAGKGDKPRPVNKKIFNQNFDQIKSYSVQTEPTQVKRGKKTFNYSKRP
jgi:hypothetical protein